MTETEILQQVLAGRTDAYGEIFSRHRARAYGLAFQYLRNKEDARDVVQEAFIKAFQNLGKFQLDKEFCAWLLTIVRNLSIDLLRRRRKISGEGLSDTMSDPGSRQMTERKVLQKEIWEALDRLSPSHREIIFLKDYQGHSYQEIAGIVGIPLGTVMSRLHHARKNFISLLGGGNHEMRAN